MPRIIVVFFIMIFLTSCNGRFDHGYTIGGTGSLAFVSNGERIYFTGKSASGMEISTSDHMNAHMHMHGSGCVSCHGVDREGKRLWPQFWIKAPALTVGALFEGDKHENGADSHGDHGRYDSGSLRRAITLGIDPSGDPLDGAMPKWNLSPTDLDDLIAYLQQSHTHD
ncbi:MAG: cytochrome c oxidase subunit 2 [Gammaproteobacteria bacterium]|jgi:cytochrome c oxidase subunit 2